MSRERAWVLWGAFSLLGCSIDDREVGVMASSTGGASGAAGGAAIANGGSSPAVPAAGAAPGAGSGGSLPDAGFAATNEGAAGVQGPQKTQADAGSESSPEAPPLPNGFFQSGDWQGFASVLTDTLGTTATPSDFSNHRAGEPYCIQGTVARDDFYGGFVAMSFNLDQSPELSSDGMAPPPGSVSPGGQGVTFELASSGGLLRAQVGSGTRLWCSDIVVLSGDAFVPWSEFREECWLPEATALYAGEPVSSIEFVVPGAATDPQPYSFCISELAESP